MKPSHDYWLKDVIPTVLNPGDEMLIFACKNCPSVLPVLLSSLIRKEGGGALPTSEESS